MARPTKLTPALQKRIVALIREGNYSTQAAAACGLSSSSFFSYMRQGRDAQAVKEEGLTLNAHQKSMLQFLDSVKGAEAEAEVAALALVQKSARAGDARQAQWYLERKFPERWGKRETHQVETTIKHAQSDGKKKSHDELLAELQKLEQEGK